MRTSLSFLILATVSLAVACDKPSSGGAASAPSGSASALAAPKPSAATKPSDADITTAVAQMKDHDQGKRFAAAKVLVAGGDASLPAIYKELDGALDKAAKMDPSDRIAWGRDYLPGFADALADIGKQTLPELHKVWTKWPTMSLLVCSAIEKLGDKCESRS